MKTKHFKTLLALIIISFIAKTNFAQSPYITSADMPLIGDTDFFFLADTNSFIFPVGGMGITWDYSGIKRGGGADSGTDVEVAPSYTSFAKDFPTANIATIPVGTTDVLLYHKDSTQLALVGSVYNISGTTVVTKFTRPEVTAIYPMSYGWILNDSFSAVANVSGQNLNESGYDHGRAIGYGTLKLPHHTYRNVLLVRDSSFVNTTGALAETITSVSYAFASPDRRYNILTLTYENFTVQGTSASGRSGTYYDTGNATEGINSVANEIENATLYPNPSENHTNLSLFSKQNTEAALTFTDMVGKEVQPIRNIHLNTGENNIEVTTKGLAPGIYFITLTQSGFSLNKKLIVD